MRILALGDIITPSTVNFLSTHLWEYRKQNKIDFVIANAENANFLAGIGPDPAKKLLNGGVDCITGGNHTLQNRSSYSFLDEDERILRPINYPGEVPGKGYTILDCNGYRVLIANAMGIALIEPSLNSPYPFLEKMLRDEEGNFDIAVLDFHAESTGEKIVLGLYFDGKFSCIWGTHTHVETADEKILPKGTAYISDIGACYPSDGVIGVSSDVILDRMKDRIPTPYRQAPGKIVCHGILFDVDESSNQAKTIKRITLKES